MAETTLEGGNGGRGGIEEPDEREGGMVEVKGYTPIIYVDDVYCTEGVRDVERMKE